MIAHHLVVALGLLLMTRLALAIDLQPGEMVARKAGTNIVQTAYFDLERDELYAQGERVPGDFRVDTQELQLRYVHYFAVEQTPAIFYVQLPVGERKPGGLLENAGGDSGAGDPVFLLGFWPYANHETRTYLIAGAYFSPPTGSYDNHNRYNMGENRYRGALQVAYQAPLYGPLEWMGALDTIWHGANDEFGINNARREQKSFNSGQLGLNYRLSDALSVAANYIHSWGAQTSIDGQAQDDRMSVDRYLLTGVWRFLEWKSQLMLQYGRDLETENGLRETKRLILRYSWQL